MTKAETAVALDVSVRSLDRFVAKGWLSPGRRLLNGRRVCDFDPGDVQKLKTILGSDKIERHTTERPSANPSDMITVSFRMSPMYVERLKQEGAKRGVSGGAMARMFLVEALERPGGQEEKFILEVQRLREAVAESFYNFLVLKCDTSKDQAKRFVTDTMLQRNSC